MNGIHRSKQRSPFNKQTRMKFTKRPKLKDVTVNSENQEITYRNKQCSPHNEEAWAKLAKQPELEDVTSSSKNREIINFTAEEGRKLERDVERLLRSQDGYDGY